MKRIFLSLLVLVSLCQVVNAKDIDMVTARQVGLRFYYQQINRLQPTRFETLKCAESFSESFQQQTAYYVFNLEGGGFVIVSADDRVTPVLGYSFDGTYSTENQPPQFISWMDGYSRQIADAREKDLPATPEITTLWDRFKNPGAILPDAAVVTTDVAPLLLSTWDQGSPYNMLCPSNSAGPGGKVWAGCVATAMSQVMYYYRWPDTGLGQHCYYPWGYPQQCANFGNTTYKWNEMTNKLTSTVTDTAGATLLWHAGIGVDMMYDPNGSGAYSEDARDAMVNYFKFTPNSVLIRKSDYSDTQWKSTLRENLDKKRPMYYDGYGSGGHAFNVDGYQGTDYFHFNWGWSGSYNGYYYLTNLNPGGSTFTEGQGAIVNLYPDTLLYSYPEYPNGQTILTAMRGTFEDGSGPARNYQNNTNSSWLIQPHSDSDSIVSITITFNIFNTEAGTDLVKIYKGSTTSDSLVGTYSGSALPPSVTVNWKEVLITFQSNNSVTKDGWFASYTTKSAEWCKGLQMITDMSGSISDGSGSYHYQNMSVCKWIINPPSANPVTLSFTEFDTEAGQDFVKIYELKTGTEIASYSGKYSAPNMPPAVTAQDGGLFLVFLTNSSVNADGWHATFSSYPVGVDQPATKAAYTVFPNPAADKLTVRIQDDEPSAVQLTLINNSGITVMERTLPASRDQKETSLAVSGLPRGLYILRLTTNRETVIRKVVLE